MLDAQLVSIYANCCQEDVVEECLSFATSPGVTCFQLLHQPLSAAQVHWITMWKDSMVWARGSQVCCTSDVDFGHLWSLIANVDPLGKINQMATVYIPRNSGVHSVAFLNPTIPQFRCSSFRHFRCFQRCLFNLPSASAARQITLGMFPPSKYEDFRSDIPVLIAVSVFVAVTGWIFGTQQTLSRTQ